MMSKVDDYEHICLPYLDVEAGGGTEDVLDAVLTAIAVPAVLLRGNVCSDFPAAKLQSIVKLVQNHNAAALLTDNAKLVVQMGADGIHISSGPQLQARYIETRGHLGDLTIGVCAGKSRHDAMMLGELGADYIGFGAPQVVQDQVKAKVIRRDLIAWWAELFEVPCVAFDADGDVEIATLARAGADFVTIPIPAGISAAKAVEKVRRANEIISQNACKAQNACKETA